MMDINTFASSSKCGHQGYPNRYEPRPKRKISTYAETRASVPTLCYPLDLDEVDSEEHQDW